MELLIKGGRLIDPATDTDGKFDIAIQDGKIKEIAPRIEPEGASEILEADGLIVSPGFIDVHVHLREPGQEHKEDIETGSRAAVRGGFTTIVCMPNTSPVNDNLEVTGHIIKRAEEVGLVNIYPVAAVSRNLSSETITHMDALVEAGVRGFSDDGRCVMSEDIFIEALKRAKTLKVPIMEHAEDHNISQDGQVNEGLISAICKLKGIPASSEDVIIARDIRYQQQINSYLHLTHISTAGAYRLIKTAKREGVAVTCDVTPHHLLLDESSVHQCDPMYKMKPPLRTPQDRSAMVSGLKDGIIDCIATDHAPHSAEEKNKPFEQAPFGVIGLETSFPVIHDRLVRTEIIDLTRMIEVFSTNPAKVMHLHDRGMVKPGVPADLTLFDPEKPFKIDAEDFHSKSVNCPFIGWEGKGVVRYTIVSGKVVYDESVS